LESVRLLLANAYRGDASDLWCAPGGGVEAGASLEANLRREVHEETGLVVRPGRLLAVSEFHDRATGFRQVDLLYLAEMEGVAASVLSRPGAVVNRIR
jgi:ADP-ribose pyrophosphatase YjhB (NUDIX family)